MIRELVGPIAICLSLMAQRFRTIIGVAQYSFFVCNMLICGGPTYIALVWIGQSGLF